MKSHYIFVLKPSEIDGDGVGVFSESNIPSGVMLCYEHDKENYVIQDGNDIPRQYLKYCTRLPNGRYRAPNDFLKMSVFWYTNHSDYPNVEFRNRRLYSVREIKPGQELLVKYRDISTHPDNLYFS